MTSVHTPYLFLKRLVVVSNEGTLAYDEAFHAGVNIISGENTSGKSTISNFIFFVLGGSLKKWTNEALRCREVFAEVDLSGSIVTLRRSILSKDQEPLSIYWGDYSTASTSVAGWQTHPYNRTHTRDSFSSVLFTALGLPEVKTDGDANLTMHQVLRLIYIDQDTSHDALFRREKFDPTQTREAVAELLLGTYDNDLYKTKSKLKASKDLLQERSSERQGLVKLLREYGAATSLQDINKLIKETEEKIVRADKEIEELQAKKNALIKQVPKSEVDEIYKAIQPVRHKAAAMKKTILANEIDFVDSGLFIQVLKNRVTELEESITTRKVFTDLPLTACPHCLTVLGEHLDTNTCMLCKQPLDISMEGTNQKRMLQQIQMQVKESEQLLESRQRNLLSLQLDYTIMLREARDLQKRLDNALTSMESTRDERINALLVDKGKLDRTIEYLTQQKGVIAIVTNLEEEIKVVNATINDLELWIQSYYESTDNKSEQSRTAVERSTSSIIARDLERQEEFRDGSRVFVQYGADTFHVEGNPEIAASSKMVLKNAIHFALLFASLELAFMRYPRFLLCDNMEDKGMEKERSQNFQKVIVGMSKQSNELHQIIFTTSMIEPALNTPEFRVGEHYTHNNRSLKL